MRQRIVAGNWKMNLAPREARALVETLSKYITDETKAEVVYCVPFVDIETVVEATKGSRVRVGAQDMHFESSGAYTGAISADMLKALGVSYSVIGHSERRMLMGETDTEIRMKVKKALDTGITPILCCGETLEQREMGVTLEWVRLELKQDLFGLSAEEARGVVIAYEPIWAIGTGKTATKDEAEEVCAAVRGLIGELYGKDTADAVRILYGGSVNKANAKELFDMPDIDGGLVGGASLKEDFGAVINA